MNYAEESLKKHYEWKGKIEIVTRAPVDNAEALSLAYTPGVAQPCLEIQKDPAKSFELTRHRILGAKGSLTGYAGGTRRKEALLRLEHVI